MGQIVSDSGGVRTYVIPECFLVETSQGHTSLLVTQIDDRSAIEANGDGVTTYEDIETIVSAVDLLAKNMLGCFVGGHLAVSGDGNFTHGSGYLDGNGMLHFTLETDCFAANEATFQYREAA